MKTVGYIYKITCLINGRCYVGSKQSSEFVETYWSSSKNPEYWNDINKYGKQNFKREILCWCKTKNQLIEYEKRYILSEKALVIKGGYNLCISAKQIIYTPEIRKKMSEKRKAYFNSNKWLKENKQKFSELKRKSALDPNGIMQSKEYREKMSKACKGKGCSEETKRKLSLINKGRKQSKETLKHLSIIRKGKYKLNRWYNNGKINKFCKNCPGKDWVLGRINFKTSISKPIICIETNKIYESAT